MPDPSIELPGLTARLDRLCYHDRGTAMVDGKQHAFIYYITILNSSDRTVQLLGRKWVLNYVDGTHLVVEGDKIVGETPRLSPGHGFSYDSQHITSINARVLGSFHGIDDTGRKVHVLLPPFDLVIPPAN